jgi:effector-binding domain-containing protein
MLKIWKIARFFLLVFILLVTGCAKQEEKKAEPGLEIKIKTTEKIRFAYLKNLGPYWEMTPLFAQVGKYAMEKGITGELMGIYYDDPAVVPPDSLRSEIGISVPEDYEPDPPFQARELLPQQVVFAVLKGPYDEIAKEYGEIMKWIEENGYMVVGPPREIYLKGGEEVPVSEFLTEVQFPVAKSS